MANLLAMIVCLPLTEKDSQTLNHCFLLVNGCFLRMGSLDHFLPQS